MTSALRLFAANGVTTSSTAQIANDAGIAAGTLFLYFPSKQELLDALVVWIGVEHSESVRVHLVPALSAREEFSAIWHGSVDWFLAHPDAYQFLQQVRDTALISDAAVQEAAQSLSYYYEAIQNGLRAGAIKPYPADLIGGVLYQDMVAVLNHIRAHDDPNLREPTIRQGFEIFWNGIATQPGAESTERSKP